MDWSWWRESNGLLQVARLFEETQRYVEGTAAATAPSRNMAERYLMEEAKRLASSQCASSDPDALDGRLNRMLDMTPNLPLTHYVKCVGGMGLEMETLFVPR